MRYVTQQVLTDTASVGISGGISILGGIDTWYHFSWHLLEVSIPGGIDTWRYQLKRYQRVGISAEI